MSPAIIPAADACPDGRQHVFTAWETDEREPGDGPATLRVKRSCVWCGDVQRKTVTPA